jgi:hypothetical protein
VDWAEHWTLHTAHVLRESDLSDWKTGDCKQLKIYAENEIDWPDSKFKLHRPRVADIENVMLAGLSKNF